MVSLDEDQVNFDALLNNLDDAIEEDRVYKLRNEAKIRAVQQRGTYEDFVNTVKGATLKPMDKSDKISCNPRQTWNPVAQKLSDDSVDGILNRGVSSSKNRTD